MNVPVVGWVTTTFWVVRISPPPTGTSDVGIVAPPCPPDDPDVPDDPQAVVTAAAATTRPPVTRICLRLGFCSPVLKRADSSDI